MASSHIFSIHVVLFVLTWANRKVISIAGHTFLNITRQMNISKHGNLKAQEDSDTHDNALLAEAYRIESQPNSQLDVASPKFEFAEIPGSNGTAYSWKASEHAWLIPQSHQSMLSWGDYRREALFTITPGTTMMATLVEAPHACEKPLNAVEVSFEVGARSMGVYTYHTGGWMHSENYGLMISGLIHTGTQLHEVELVEGDMRRLVGTMNSYKEEGRMSKLFESHIGDRPYDAIVNFLRTKSFETINALVRACEQAQPDEVGNVYFPEHILAYSLWGKKALSGVKTKAEVAAERRAATERYNRN